MNEHIVELTDAAVAHIRKIIARKGAGIGFRLSVKQAGCTGYKYQPEVVTEILADDLQFVTAHGLTVFIEPSCAQMIRGTLIDYVSKGPGQQQLVFHNPNIDSECGCGESFYLKKINDENNSE